MQTVPKDICFIPEPTQADHLREVYPKGIRVNFMRGRGNILYNPDGRWVDINKVSNREKSEILRWGVTIGIIEHSEVFYVVEVTPTDSLYEKEFPTITLAEAYASKVQRKVFTKKSYVTTPRYENMVGLSRTLIGSDAELSAELYYFHSQNVAHGVLLDKDNNESAMLFMSGTSTWLRLANVGEYLTRKMMANEETVCKADKYHTQRQAKLKELTVDNRLGNTNYFIEPLQGDAFMVVGCGQAGYFYGGKIKFLSLHNSSFTTMSLLASELGELKSHKIIKAQHLR